jgi:hypothetical protein
MKRTLVIVSIASVFAIFIPQSSAASTHEGGGLVPVKQAQVKKVATLPDPKVAEIAAIEPVSPPVVAAPVQTPTAPVVNAPAASTSANCGSDSMMAYIYTVESGCRSWAVNPGGCIGLGQACPGGKLPCGLYDWGCQDAWFRAYAVRTYGSIYNAYIYRQGHNYW